MLNWSGACGDPIMRTTDLCSFCRAAFFYEPCHKDRLHKNHCAKGLFPIHSDTNPWRANKGVSGRLEEKYHLSCCSECVPCALARSHHDVWKDFKLQTQTNISLAWISWIGFKSTLKSNDNEKPFGMFSGSKISIGFQCKLLEVLSMSEMAGNV